MTVTREWLEKTGTKISVEDIRQMQLIYEKPEGDNGPLVGTRTLYLSEKGSLYQSVYYYDKERMNTRYPEGIELALKADEVGMLRSGDRDFQNYHICLSSAQKTAVWDYLRDPQNFKTHHQETKKEKAELTIKFGKGCMKEFEKDGESFAEIRFKDGDIRMAGLEQPLVVYPKDGAFVLLTGERRLAAIDLLIESGTWDPQKDIIPCIERPLDLYRLPLDDDLKELYAILRTNAFNRKMSDADLLVQAEDYAKVIRELKKQGYKEVLIGYDEAGDPIQKDITERTRKIVADMIGVSNGQVGKIESILKNGTEELKEAVQNGEINIAAASKLSSYTGDEQNAFLRENIDPKINAPEVAKRIEASHTAGLEGNKEELAGQTDGAPLAEPEQMKQTERDEIQMLINKMKQSIRRLETAWKTGNRDELQKHCNFIGEGVNKILIMNTNQM